MTTLPPLHAKTPRIVAVDFGTKRVGLAVSDPLRLFAQPAGTYSQDQAVDVLRRLRSEHGIECIVVGWPLELDGHEGAATRMVQPYINRLRNAFPEIEIVKLDERFTSEIAKRRLYESGLGKQKRREKGRVDEAAAAVILQDYLDDLTHD